MGVGAVGSASPLPQVAVKVGPKIAAREPCGRWSSQCAVVLSTSVSFGANLFGCVWRSPLPWTVTGLSAGSCLPRKTYKTDRQIDRLEQPGAGRNQEGCVQPIARRVCACQLANVPGICNGTAPTPPTDNPSLCLLSGAAPPLCMLSVGSQPPCAVRTRQAQQ